MRNQAHRSWQATVCIGALCWGTLACSRQTTPSPEANTAQGAEALQEAPSTRTGRGTSQSAVEGALLSTFHTHRKDAPDDYSALEATLGPRASDSAPPFDVTKARFYDLVVRRLRLKPNQVAQLRKRGAVSVRLAGDASMGRIYASLWQADLPAFITTDSILHAWHKTYDEILARRETTTFASAYLELLDSVASSLSKELPEDAPKLRAAATHLDLYINVARSLLTGQNPTPAIPSADAAVPQGGVSPTLAKLSDVEAIVRAAYTERIAQVPVFGEVDFSQFKPRGHYTRSPHLQQYFRALMWMGRADTGFALDEPNTTRVALLLAWLADHSGKLEAFAQTQQAIDFFVGSANGLSLLEVVKAMKRERVRGLAELEDDSRVRDLGAKVLQATPATRITSQAVFAGDDTPPPAVFQLSSQRFTVDSFVHQQTSDHRVPGRTMVTGLDVFAAIGNAEATRLLKPELDTHDYSADLYALRKTIDELPTTYWEQDLYTRWFDALRTLARTPEGAALPALFRSQIWQRKQLSNQLASWAELRRDTTLYVAQSYSSLGCDFPDAYLEPYPDFYDRMRAMALEAQFRLGQEHALQDWVEVMGKLSDIARRELTLPSRNAEDQAFLRELVKLVTVRGCGPPTHRWTGWYARLFPHGDIHDYEPIIADVFTAPQIARVLNAATTTPDLLVVALDTQRGPTIFAGPAAGYREFIGGRMTDAEWEQQLETGQAPPAPAWNILQAGWGQLPAPHPTPPSPQSREWHHRRESIAKSSKRNTALDPSL